MWLKSLLKSVIVAILTFEAKLVLRKYEPTIIAVTGSVGKTSTKDAIFSVLKRTHFVRKSAKTLNTDIGVPLTILGCENAWWNLWGWIKNMFDGLLLIILPSSYPEWLVLEMGADHPGDIKHLASWVRPDIAVIGRIPDMPVHVEFFDSGEAVLREKKHLADALLPQGTLVVYGDDKKTEAMGREAKEAGKNVLSYGTDEHNTVRGSELEMMVDRIGGRPTGMRFTAHVEGKEYPVLIYGTVGRQHMYAALAALAVSQAVGVNMAGAIEALQSHETPPGRMRLLPGIKGTTLIDDSYNSSPAAVDEALGALSHIPTGKGRKIAILGDMLELGKFSAEEHRAVGKKVAGIAHLLGTVGFRARDIADGALSNGMKDNDVLQYEDSRKAGKEFEGLIKEGDIVLIKGSQSIRMERTVEELMAEPEKAEDLLVRQDPEWLRKA